MYSNGRITEDLVSVFGGRKAKYQGEEFPGANIKAIFGGVDLDIRDAILTEDVVIQVTTILGGVDIYVPEDVEVRINSLPILGSVSDRMTTTEKSGKAVIHVNATCILGGVDII